MVVIMSYHFDRIIDVTKDGQPVWKIPQKTLFDKITDLWQLISDYYFEYRPIVLGKIDELYTDYKLITRNEFNNPLFTKLFKTNYLLHGGIYSLSLTLTYSSDVHVLSETLYIDYNPVYVCINKSEYSKIYCCGRDILEYISSIRCGASQHKRETGLFIQNGLQLL